MPDDLRTRIVAVQANHVEGQLTNYDAEREECGCGHQGNATYREHLADAVIAELDSRGWLIDPQAMLRAMGMHSETAWFGSRGLSQPTRCSMSWACNLMSSWT